MGLLRVIYLTPLASVGISVCDPWNKIRGMAKEE